MSCSSSNSAATLSLSLSYIGINLENILYGIEIALYFQTMHIFLGRRRQRKHFDVVYAVFSTVMFLSVTVSVANSALLGQEMWLIYRGYPGGLTAYTEKPSSRSYFLLATAMTLILQQMTDGLMIYRSHIMCHSHFSTIVPCILWLATLALGVTLCWASVSTGRNPYVGLQAQLELAYCTTSVFLNVTLTCMMCYRMVSHGKKVKEYLGPEFASPYFSIVMLLVESALPLAFSGIAFLVALGIRSPMEMPFSRVYILMMCVAPQMLILRVAEGRAWHKDSFKPPDSVIAFSPVDSSHPTFFSESRPDVCEDDEKVGIPRITRLASSPE